MPNTGLGQRLAARIKAKGYGAPGTKFGINVSEFALDHRYNQGSLFKWLNDTVLPDYAMMLRLARDLDTSPAWLHYGDQQPTTKPRRPTAGRGGIRVQKPQEVDATSSLKEKHTTSGVSARKDAALCQSRGQTMARRLLRPAPTVASGGHRRVA
jgi:hypothetical protein